jgi:hypothetical protein
VRGKDKWLLKATDLEGFVGQVIVAIFLQVKFSRKQTDTKIKKCVQEVLLGKCISLVFVTIKE